MYDLIDVQIKNISVLMHQMVLLKTKIKTFHTANEILNKRHKTKKNLIRIEKSFNVLKTNVLQLQKKYH